LRTEQLVLHMIFKGNPGTGKTTIARIMGKLFRSMGVLSQGHLIEVERADLVGEYIGHTAHKTREQIKKAMGGILFIDEAYSLARGGEKDFGKESIDVLVKAMEDHKDNLVLILAGYKREMEWFLRSNPGLYSRFPIHITFPDYSVEELLQIGTLMLKKRQYRLLPEARITLRKILEEKTRQGNYNEGNARLVRNLIEKAIRRQAVRLVKYQRLTRDELMIIRSEDFE
ncbi:MAG: AAA family ATPase, partial [Syntrophaceticus sp.]